MYNIHIYIYIYIYILYYYIIYIPLYIHTHTFYVYGNYRYGILKSNHHQSWLSTKNILFYYLALWRRSKYNQWSKGLARWHPLLRGVPTGHERAGSLGGPGRTLEESGGVGRSCDVQFVGAFLKNGGLKPWVEGGIFQILKNEEYEWVWFRLDIISQDMFPVQLNSGCDLPRWWWVGDYTTLSIYWGRFQERGIPFKPRIKWNNRGILKSSPGLTPFLGFLG